MLILYFENVHTPFEGNPFLGRLLPRETVRQNCEWKDVVKHTMFNHDNARYRIRYNVTLIQRCDHLQMLGTKHTLEIFAKQTSEQVSEHEYRTKL